MQNLVIGVVLIGLALLAGAVLLFHVLGPDLRITPLPNVELREPETNDIATVQVIVGGEDPRTEVIVEESRRRMSPEAIRDQIENSQAPLTAEERASLDVRGRLPYVVRKGDTLSALARRYLGDETLWRAILDANPHLTRPEDLREGQTVLIPMREAR